MNSANKKVLSICIPTYNRAELLRIALLSLTPQVQELQDEVELIVSDNCSPDQTKEVVEWAQQFGPLRYNRNQENIGPCRNMLSVTELAQGEFCWILGDDDLVRPGGVKRVLQVIKENPEIDYVFVNLAHIAYAALGNYPYPVSSKDLPDNLPPHSKLLEDLYIEEWETLLDPEIVTVFFGEMQVSVFRRAIWHKFSQTLNIGELFSNLDSTYPHVKILAQGLIGKKAYYLGKPWVVVVDGLREWWDFVPMIYLVRLHEVLDLYLRLGVDRKQINYCRTDLLNRSGPMLKSVITDPAVPGREYISLWKFFCRFWFHKVVRQTFLEAVPFIWRKSLKVYRKRLKKFIKRKIKRPLKKLKKRALGWLR